MQFKEIPGLSDLKSALIQSVKRSHVSHSQLFYSAEGGAQLAMAFAYATYINCENRQETDSCGACASCHKMAKIAHPDFHQVFAIPSKTAKEKGGGDSDKKGSTIDDYVPLWRTFLQKNIYQSLADWHEHIGAEKNKQAAISAEEARKIIQKVSLKAYEAEYKILIVWLPELMNSSAANAILKVLEEPPAKTLFLMVSNDPNKLLPTILSRTILVNIPLFEDNNIVNYLVYNNIAENTRAKQVAYLAEGNLSKAIEIVNQADEGLHENFAVWMRLCFKPDIAGLIKQADQFALQSKTAQKQLLEYGLSMFRDIFLWINGGQKLIRLEGDELQFVERFGKVVNPDSLEFITNEMSETSYHLERNANAKILFLDLSLRIVKVIKLNKQG
ncbi:MAG: DNA polymerase III subunit delta [Bacteroidota bacterium]